MTSIYLQIVYFLVILIIIIFFIWEFFLFVLTGLNMLSKVYSSFYIKLFGRKNFRILALPIPLYFRYKYVQRNKEFQSNKKHIAIILANNWIPEKYLSYGVRVDKLIKYLKTNKKPYKVYDELNAQQIKGIINKDKTNSLIIVGHGTRHSLQTGQHESLYYCELDGSKKKDFLAQFHCNHNRGKSLAEYISKKDTICFITDDFQNDSGINKQIEKIIQNKLL